MIFCLFFTMTKLSKIKTSKHSHYLSGAAISMVVPCQLKCYLCCKLLNLKTIQLSNNLSTIEDATALIKAQV